MGDEVKRGITPSPPTPSPTRGEGEKGKGKGLNHRDTEGTEEHREEWERTGHGMPCPYKSAVSCRAQLLL